VPDQPGAVAATPAGAAGGQDEATRQDLTTLARGGALNLVGAVATGVLHFVLVLIIARALDTGGTGAFFEAVALFLILSAAAALGADIGLSRMVPRYRALGRVRDIRRGIWIGLWPVLAAGTAASLLASAWAPELARVFAGEGDSRQLADFIRAFALFIPVYALSLAVFAATRGFGTMRPSVLVDKIARPALQPLLVLGAILAGGGSTLIALAWAGPFLPALAAGFLWLLVLVRRVERRRTADAERARPVAELIGEFWRFTGPRGLAVVFQTTSLWLNTLLLGALSSTSDAGVYAASTRYLVAGTMLAVAIQQVMGPKLSELLTRERRDRAAAVYQTASCWLVALNWPIYLTLILFGVPLLALFGDAFTEGQVVLTILASAMLVATAVGPVDVVLLMGGRSSWNLFNTVLALTANLALNFALTPRFGLAGAATAFAVSILLNNLVPLAQVWRLLRLHPFGRGVWTAAALSAACFGGVGVAVRALLGPTAAGFAVYALVACGLYAALLWRFRDRLEADALRGLLRGRLRRPAGQPLPGGGAP
jgi:O-antigen/teichoic acid export membrane protein